MTGLPAHNVRVHSGCNRLAIAPDRVLCPATSSMFLIRALAALRLKMAPIEGVRFAE